MPVSDAFSGSAISNQNCDTDSAVEYGAVDVPQIIQELCDHMENCFNGIERGQGTQFENLRIAKRNRTAECTGAVLVLYMLFQKTVSNC